MLEGNPSLVRSDFDNPPGEPFELLNRWFEAARKVGVREPEAMTLSTSTREGRCSNRLVALKGFDSNGLVFCSQQESAKGRDLKENPWSGGSLWWQETVQQVTFAGPVTVLPDAVSDEMFAARDRYTRAVSIVSSQSEPMVDEAALRASVDALAKSDKNLARPSGWSAFAIQAQWIEFWHGSADRFHKRLRYDWEGDGWRWNRLQP